MKETEDLQTRILVVDDNRQLVQLIQEVLQRAGYVVLTAFDGLEGLTKARAETPDLIIMDINMPKLNGYQVCRTLQADPTTASLPILMLTARGQVDPPPHAGVPWSLEQGVQERMEGFESGALEFLSKPIAASELVAQVRKVLALAALGGQV
jgi:DNA-binding response OmpR family regulator